MADNKLAALMGDAVAELEDDLEIERTAGAQPIVAPKRPSTAPARTETVAAAGAGGAAPVPAPAPAEEAFSELQSGFEEPTAEAVAASDASSAVTAAAAAPDDFGIVYKKKVVPKKTAPSAAALADEKLFEEAAKGSAVLADVTHSAAAAEGEEDDEFAFDFAEGGGSAPRGLVQSAQERARERKKLAEAAEAKAAAELEALKKEAAAIAGVPLEDTPKEEPKAAAAAAVELSAPSGALGALAEGEEEEEEDEEEEEEPVGEAAVEAPAAAAGGGFGEDAVAAAFDGFGGEEEAIAAEFDAATEIIQGRAKAAEDAGPGVAGGYNTKPPTIRYPAAERHFIDDPALQTHLASATTMAPDPDAGCCGALFKTTMPPERAVERDNVFCIAKVAYDHTVGNHQAIMASIFKGITGVDFVGTQSTWEVVGFQRADFTTDLRGGGMYGPLQMLYLVTAHKPFVGKLYTLSQDHVQNFPLMAQSLTMTARTMQALRFGKLNALAVAKGSTYAAANLFFCGLWFEFLQAWTSRGSTIADMHYVMEHVTQVCNKNPAAAVARFEAAVGKPVFQAENKFSAMD